MTTLRTKIKALLLMLLILLLLAIGCQAEDPLVEGFYTTTINNSGTITTDRILYSRTYFDDLRTPASAIRLVGVKPPKETEYKGGAVLEFENVAAPNEQQVFFIVQLPHSWKEGTALSAHVHWAPKTDTGGIDQTVIWQLTHSWANIDAVLPAPTTITATETINDRIDEHIMTSFPLLDATGKLLSSMLICSLTRLSGTDTYTDSAYFLEVDFHYEVDSPGSETLAVK